MVRSSVWRWKTSSNVFSSSNYHTTRRLLRCKNKAASSSPVSLFRLSESSGPYHVRFFSSSTKSSKERLRVAVVGGGAAGLSTALHLAPLVTEGLISGPIDIYDSQERPSHRDIGVGIWSTALDAFQKDTLDSHRLAVDDMLRKGTFVHEAGYRTPQGDWLAESNLEGEGLPDLLFLREMDMLDALRKAVHLEVNRGNVVLHSGSHYKVDSIMEDATTEPWSAPLMLLRDGPDQPSVPTERDYHLIVAADGMNSVLRTAYGGFNIQSRILTGMYAMDDAVKSRGSARTNARDEWAISNQADATGIQDRNYSVFRGNAPVTRNEVQGLDRSFQTWGEGRNMRFATVPMCYPGKDGVKEERHVWFITIDDDTITSETDPSKRKELLLEAFADWHDPIGQLVTATPPQEILMERALAHRHSQQPVVDFYGLINKVYKKSIPAIGQGPAIQYVGDAFLTVDPILAQGFTVGMEGAATLANALESCLTVDAQHHFDSKLAFDPYLLRKELMLRHDSRLHRLICLLRITELVQALGQPISGTLAGMISRDIIRPIMKLSPNFIKTPIFNAVLQYSLGLPPTKRG
ncbi:FAD-dependent oxidoreductase [Nitzschia inconspicua]|uniref:FAD-dependent oxidoreductase n=1 Tax=Nitzschia inconspicua TaxID=303405 RepID=A0A9K3KZF6_9STRA|nr:FAD-dependent oxidoreductase [Nitzschia inconspicua]